MISDIDEFKIKTKGLIHQPKAIFPSEMFLFYCEVKRIDVDHIIESGIGYGGSTSYLDRLFPETLITSIDRGSVEQTRALHPRIDFVIGDGRFEIEWQIAKSKAKRLAILIDGPKGWIAVKLAERLLTKKNVKIVAVHDLQSDKQSLALLPSVRERIGLFLDKAFVDSHKLREFISELDIGVKALKKYPNGPGLSIYKC